MVLWFIGKSGAGKSVIGRTLFDLLKKELTNLIFFDGDELRDAISWDLSHSPEDRFISEQRRSNLCKLISDQGVSIICSAISNSIELRNWNKNNIKNYYEIYLKVQDTILYKRDSKGLYSSHKKNQISNIVGEDIIFNEPFEPYIVIENNGNQTPEEIAGLILKKLKKDLILKKS